MKNESRIYFNNYIRRYLNMICRILILLYMTIFVSSQNIIDAGPSFVDSSGILECQRKQYTFRVTQSDINGNKCWDTLSVTACWGRCDSNEVSYVEKNLIILPQLMSQQYVLCKVIFHSESV